MFCGGVKMMEAKRYDCRAILAAHCLALANDEKPDLRAALASVGIPKDRLDVALREIQPVMFGATQQSRAKTKTPDRTGERAVR
jgi:hypothetical protein